MVMPLLLVSGVSFKGHSSVSQPRMRLEDLGQIESTLVCLFVFNTGMLLFSCPIIYSDSPSPPTFRCKHNAARVL